MSLRIVITTPLNDNLYHAKLIPLLRAREDVEIVVVTDHEGPTLDRVRWVWPRGLSRFLGRLGGRFLLLLGQVLHPRTKAVMAYNIIPHGLFAVVAAWPRRIPVFLHFIAGAADFKFAHNPQITDNRLILRTNHPARYEKLAQWTTRHGNRLFVPGRNTAVSLRELGLPDERIVRLHSTIDPQIYFRQDESRDIDVLVSAQLRPRKRPLFALEVFKRILEKRPQTRFCWLGDGPLHDEFAESVKQLGLNKSLEWTETNNVAPFYRRARVFLLCSINEGLSLACMEAMACGMVPVTTDCGDMCEIVRNGHTGRLLPVDAEQEIFAQAVLELLDNSIDWQHCSQASSELICQEHSFPAAIKTWKQLLNTIQFSE